MPQFTPELFVRVTPKNVMKQKSFHKGIEQLVQEGAIQLFRSFSSNEYILGAVGQLQFEVFQFRMENEYHSDVIMEPMGKKIARWIDSDQLDENMASSRNLLVKDRRGELLFLFENRFAENWFIQKYPSVKLTSKL
ncbi:Peptide chain release factor 3 [Furfurilactobacillus rossiae]|nr:Peptide chain release factor 3 [Furfurilactobacillus rossiae]